MKTVLIWLDIMCIAVLAVLSYGCIYETRFRSDKNRAFVKLTNVGIFALIMDILAYVLDGRPSLRILLYFLNYPVFILGMWLTYLFMKYMFLRQWRKSDKASHIIMALFYYCIGVSFMTLIGAITGTVYSIGSDGWYVTGPLCPLSDLADVIPLLFAIYVAIERRRELGKHDFRVVMIYITIPVVALVFQEFFPDYTFTFIAGTISIVMVYVMLQAGETEFSRMSAEASSKSSRTDLLTMLQNRRALEEDLEDYKYAGEIGVIFCDINGLKAINDREGHDAGDEMLKHFAELLTGRYNPEDVYRFSSDEFVVLLPNTTKEETDRTLSMLKLMLKDKGSIASAGASYGKVFDIADIIRKAEVDMLADKRSSY